MSSYINRGESVFFQFRNGESVLNSQCKPRMFKTAEKATLGVNYIETDDVVEYAEAKHGRWVDNGIPESMLSKCSVCDYSCGAYSFNYCPNCGAKMDGGIKHESD